MYLAIPFCFGARELERAIATILTFIDLEALLQARSVFFRLVFLKANVSTIRANKAIILLFIRPVGSVPDVLLVSSGFLLQIVAVGYEKLKSRLFFFAHRIQVVFLAAIASVGNHGFGHRQRRRRQSLHMRNKASCIRRTLMDAVEQNKLVFRGHLHIVAWLQLAIFHVIFLHAHKRGVRIGFRVAVAIAKAGFLLLILGEARKEILPNLFQRPLQGTARFAQGFPLFAAAGLRELFG
nr:hypothetical protein [Brevibacillus composti]